MHWIHFDEVLSMGGSICLHWLLEWLGEKRGPSLAWTCRAIKIFFLVSERVGRGWTVTWTLFLTDAHTHGCAHTEGGTHSQNTHIHTLAGRDEGEDTCMYKGTARRDTSEPTS